MHEGLPRLSFRAGQVLAHSWPKDSAPPFGMRAVGDHFEGPARLRWRLRAALQHARIEYRDVVTASSMPEPPHVCRSITRTANTAALTTTLRQACYRGLLAGLAEACRVALVAELVRGLAQQLLVVVSDSAAEHRWQRALASQQLADLSSVSSVKHAAQRMHWLGCRHEVLVVDAPELMPRAQLDSVLEQSAALARIGMLGRADPNNVLHWSSGLGPLLGVTEDQQRPRCLQLRVPMPNETEQAYTEAWSTFLNAYDRFAATRTASGFGTFVSQARKDPLQRPALRAWHDAVRLAAWHEHKAAVTADLLRRHQGDRVLLFTPDRKTAYELSRTHLIPAITAEIPRAERQALLDAFANGSLRTIAGPRLLDTGIAERSADVAILIGGGFGGDQRRSRCRRVRTAGIIYELVSQETLEVGRAHRFREPGTDAAVVLPMQ